MTLPSFVASSTADGGAGANGTTLVITRPAAWDSGKVAYVGLYKENNGAVTLPSGWTQVATINSGTRFWSYVFRKVLGGSEPSSYTFSWTGSVWREGGGLAILDADQTTPENGTVQTAAGGSASSTITCPAATPTVASTLILCFGFMFADNASYTSNDGMTERIDVGGIPGRAYTAATETGPASGVSTGTNTFTAANSDFSTGFTILVQEVQTAGGVTVTPAAAAAGGSTTGPTVVAGSLSLTPSPAAAMGATVGPTVVAGSVALTPTPAAAATQTVGPTVLGGGLSVTPAPAAAATATLLGTVVQGSQSVAPAAASAATAALLGAVVHGAIVVIPSPAAARTATLGPTVVVAGGSTALTPAPAGAGTSVAGPGVVQSSLVLVPPAVSAGTNVVQPIVLIVELAPLQPLVITFNPASGIGTAYSVVDSVVAYYGVAVFGMSAFGFDLDPPTPVITSDPARPGSARPT